MNETAQKEVIIRAITSEVHSVDPKILSLLLSGNRLLGVGMTVSMGILAGAFREPRLQPILIILPTIVFVFLYSWLATATEIRSLGAYRRHLEERLEKLLGQRYLLWETTISPLRYRDAARCYVHVIYGVVLMCLIGFSIYVCLGYQWGRLAFTLSLWYFLLILGLVHSYKARESVFETVHKACLKQLCKKGKKRSQISESKDLG